MPIVACHVISFIYTNQTKDFILGAVINKLKNIIMSIIKALTNTLETSTISVSAYLRLYSFIKIYLLCQSYWLIIRKQVYYLIIFLFPALYNL